METSRVDAAARDVDGLWRRSRVDAAAGDADSPWRHATLRLGGCGRSVETDARLRYDVYRFVNEYLLFASIQNDVVGTRKLLASGLVTAAPDAVKDQNKFRSVHFFALHEQPQLVADSAR